MKIKLYIRFSTQRKQGKIYMMDYFGSLTTSYKNGMYQSKKKEFKHI